MFGRMASASVLKKLTQRAEQAEAIISQLKASIEVLRQNAALSVSKPEEERLRKENEKLRTEITALKQELILAEVKNGVKQVPLPIIRSLASKTLTSDAVPEGSSANDSSATPQSSQSAPADSSKGKKQNEKAPKESNAAGKQKKKGGNTGGKDAGEPERMDVSRLDFRVGKIVEVCKHPDADSLYIEKVDLGEGKLRTVVSGLVKFVPIEQMQDKVAVFMCNLKPAKMRGVLSEAMIMCASTPEKVEILNVPEGSNIGDRVEVEGFTGEPDAQLNPKKKVWETLKDDLQTNDKKIATYQGVPLKVKGKGPLAAPSLSNVPIK